MALQAVAVTGLLLALSRRMQLSFAAGPAVGRASEFMGPTGQFSSDVRWLPQEYKNQPCNPLSCSKRRLADGKFRTASGALKSGVSVFVFRKESCKVEEKLCHRAPPGTADLA